MILGAGEMQVPIIKRCSERGLYTIVADYDAKAVGFKYADKVLVISTIDFDAVYQASQDNDIDGILTTSDFPVNIVAKVSEKLGLYSMTSSLANICTNKFLQRDFFYKNDINSPKFELIEQFSDLDKLTHYPLIIKPVDSSASRGVKLVLNKHELLEQYPLSKNYSNSGKVIVEQYIGGQEFSVETFSQQGEHNIIAITEKKLLSVNSSSFVEDTHILPADISSEIESSINIFVFDLLNKLNVNNCPCHIELKYYNNDIYIIEIACRLGGDFITSDLVPLATGVDMLDNLINVSLGDDLNVEKTKNKIASIQFANKNNYASIKSLVSNNNDFIVTSNIEEFHDREIQSSLDRMGYLILEANDHKEINFLLEKINKPSAQ